MKITEKIFDLTTGEETIIERDETAIEKKDREKLQKELAEQQAEAEARQAQRQVILDRLGLTSEEARLILGS
jgi:Rps23 Pro-64 3,4-dihydroxylase Tpa1-like proline 4-hydroxylase